MGGVGIGNASEHEKSRGQSEGLALLGNITVHMSSEGLVRLAYKLEGYRSLQAE